MVCSPIRRSCSGCAGQHTILGVSEGGALWLTALENHNVEEVFEEFAVAADEEGLLDRCIQWMFQFNN